MAIEPRKNVHSYPVWVGNLKETVEETDLDHFFSRCGTVISCKVMRNEDTGKSKGFGYVNFISEDDAERAAKMMHNFSLDGMYIKTKGPGVLRQEGYLDSDTHMKAKSLSPDYRPLTDCSFFMEERKCTKGKDCRYRHSRTAQTSSFVCSEWKEKRCLNINCPFRHPGGLKSNDGPVLVQPKNLQKCGGKCGETKCTALFESKEDLSQHINAITPTKMPQCRSCRAIFPSHTEYENHMQTCWARGSYTSNSTDHSSESPEVEVLSDDYLLDRKDPIGARSHEGVNVQAFSRPSQSVSSESFKTKSSNRRGRNRRSKSQKVNLSSASDQGFTHVKGKSPNHSSSSGLEPYHDQLDEKGFEYSHQEEYGDSDDEIFEYSVGEMARLLSLNEQDMLDNDESSNEGEEKGIGSDSKGASKNNESRTTESKPVTTTHKVHLEPVGVFWDIENCPVPLDKSAFGVAAKMRKKFIEGKREAEFMCVCDITKERKEVTDDLHKAQVTLVHVNAIAKNAADDKLRQSLRRFAHTYPAPATVVLISGDVNFSMDLNDLIHLHNITVVLVHNCQASDALKVFATRLVLYDSFIEDVEHPSRKQNHSLSQIVIVSGLPRQVPAFRISSRLDRISDNCGGKVLGVDPKSGTARVLFRTNDWAMKALKRMNGEDVFGCKITTALEPPRPQPQQNMSHLVGPDLAKTFPPAQKYGGDVMTQMTPPLLHPPYRSHCLPHPRVPFNPTRGPPPINQYPNHPLLPRPPILLPPRPLFPPPRGRYPLFSRPPSANPKHLPLGSSSPEGKILIFKINPSDELSLTQNIHLLQSNAFLSAEFLILWHNYSELQVLLKVDFIQTAIIRKEEIIQTLYEKGDLQPKAASKFVETCTKSISDVLRRHEIQWDVTTCGWSPEEEDNRITRSNVVDLLRKNPTCWTKFTNFKKKYVDTYSTAVSEMTIHHVCKGAVQILGDQSSSEDHQVIIFYEFSPLIKIASSNPLAKLKDNIAKFLSMQPDKRIKLLDFVSGYRGAKLGPLPASANGKMLQEVITSVPNVSLVGNKPSNIYVTLNTSRRGQSEPRAPAPNNLAGISAAFCHLLKQPGKNGLPLKRIQQEYQTFFHHSFRVCDYLSGDVGMKELIEACHGMKIVTVSLPSGKKEDRVYLDSIGDTPKPSLEKSSPEVPVSSKARAKAPKDLPGISANFRLLLQTQGRDGIPLKKFQQDYQTFFHHSFKVSDYITDFVQGEGTRALLKVCQRVKVVSVDLYDGRKEERVFLADFTPQVPVQTPRVPVQTPQVPVQTPQIPVQAPQVPVQAPQVPVQTPQVPVQIPQVPVQKASANVFRSSSESKERGESKKVPRSREGIAANFRYLLEQSDNKQLPLRNFQQEYQTFFHHSFRVSNYIPGADVGLKDLLQVCPGIKIVKTGRETLVYLDNEAKHHEKAESSVPTQKLSQAAVQKFRRDCVDVLSAVEGHSLLLCSFPEHYFKVKGVQFLLANYEAQKLIHLVEAISNVVQILVDDKGSKVIKLIELDPKKQCEREFEVLLYEQPKHSITLDRFMFAYQTKYGQKLAHFHGNAKLLKLLEDFPETIQIEGNGPGRLVSLQPLRIFACEMTELLSSSSSPMAINKIVPAFKEKFKRDLTVTLYGYPKLIRALEALPELISIQGTGPTRTVTLKPLPNYTSLFSSLSFPSSVSSPSPSSPATTHSNQFVDEIMALLMSTHGQKLSLIELTKKYNALFRSNLPKIESHELLQATQKLPNFKVSGTGPTCYVHLLAQSTVGSTPKKNTKKSSPVPVATPTNRAETSPRDAAKDPNIDIYQDMPKLISPVVKKRLFDDPQPNIDVPSASVQEEDGKRLCSETRRLLLCHPEHAMTLTEMAEYFCDVGDPSNPTPQSLLDALNRFNGNAGDKNSSPKKFEISHFPNDVGVSLVQLNNMDCLHKLGEDLLHLFVYHPTHNLSLHVSRLESLYAECYSRKLVASVYGSKDLQCVLKRTQLQKVIQTNQVTWMCSPCGPHRQLVIIELFAELLFSKGNECYTLDNLPRLYFNHFKHPLPLACFDVKDIFELMQLPKVWDAISLVRVKDNQFKPVLKPTTLFVEQLRHLLTKWNGRFALDQLESLYTDTFGIPSDQDILKYLKKKLPHFSLRVVNYASLKWVVWAPTGYPYPPQRRDVVTLDNTSSQSLPTVANFKPDASDINSVSEFPDLIDFFTDLQSANSIGMASSNLEPKKVDFSTKSGLNGSTFNASSIPTLEVGGVVGSSTENDVSDIPFDPSPYDFLKDDPKLLAELSKRGSSVNDSNGLPDEDLKVLTEVLTLQRLQELRGSSVSDSLGEVPVLPHSDGPIDYSLNPDQVLIELQMLKERSGGVLTPNQMDPFLDYFGELSSRELDRIKSLEGKSRTKREVGIMQKKRLMAIRFPSQSLAPPSTPNREPCMYDANISPSKLPIADFDDLSSGSDNSENPPRPIDSSEYIKKCLEKETSGDAIDRAKSSSSMNDWPLL